MVVVYILLRYTIIFCAVRCIIFLFVRETWIVHYILHSLRYMGWYNLVAGILFLFLKLKFSSYESYLLWVFFRIAFNFYARYTKCSAQAFSTRTEMFEMNYAIVVVHLLLLVVFFFVLLLNFTWCIVWSCMKMMYALHECSYIVFGLFRLCIAHWSWKYVHKVTEK